MGKRPILLFIVLLLSSPAWAGGLRVALVSDSHIGVRGAEEALSEVVADINRDKTIRMVIHLGDVTDHGTENEFAVAAGILARLDKKYFVITGNHDTKTNERWEESYVTYFGNPDFWFVRRGIVFAGLPSGPYHPDQNGKEFLRERELKRLASAKSKKPVLLFIHHPLGQVKNIGDLIALPIWINVQAEFCGHIHTDKVSEQKGIPVVNCRSSLKDADGAAGYTVVTLRRGKITVSSRRAADGRETIRWEGKITK